MQLPIILIAASCNQESRIAFADQKTSSVANGGVQVGLPVDQRSEDGDLAPTEAEPKDPLASEPVLIGGSYLVCLPVAEDESIDCILKNNLGLAIRLPERTKIVWQVVYEGEPTQGPEVIVKDISPELRFYNLKFPREAARRIELRVGTEEVLLDFSLDALNPVLISKALTSTVETSVLSLSAGTSAIGDGAFAAADAQSCVFPELYSTPRTAVPRMDFKIRVMQHTKGLKIQMRNVCSLQGQRNRAQINGPLSFIPREVSLLPNVSALDLMPVEAYFLAGEYTISLLAGTNADGSFDDYGFASIAIISQVPVELVSTP